jgi:hypothetical protein
MGIDDRSRKVPTLLTVEQFSKKHPAFTKNSLRYLIFWGEKNGMNRALRRLGRRVFISEDDFFDVIENQNNEYGGNENGL